MDTSQILIDIRKIVRAINLESKRIQKDFGVSIPQLLCLRYLSTCKNYLSTQRDMTKFLHLNSSTVTGIVNRLEKKGLVARLPKSQDKRVTHITLTANGSQILAASPRLLHDKLTSKLGELAESDIEKILNSLQLLTTSLDIQDVDASPLITLNEPISSENGFNENSSVEPI